MEAPLDETVLTMKATIDEIASQPSSTNLPSAETEAQKEVSTASKIEHCSPKSVMDDAMRSLDVTKETTNSESNDDDEPDILMDAFETMADIAVELFKSPVANNSNNEHDVKKTDFTTLYHLGTESDNIHTDEDDGCDDKKIIDTPSSNKNLDHNTSIDIPFDELGKISSAATDSNRQDASTPIARLRYNDMSTKDTKLSTEDQKKFTAQTKKSSDNDNHQNNSITMDLDNVGSLLESVTKPIGDVLYQSQAALYTALVGNSRREVDDDYSSDGSSFYDSDTEYDFDEDNTEIGEIKQKKVKFQIPENHRSTGKAINDTELCTEQDHNLDNNSNQNLASQTTQMTTQTTTQTKSFTSLKLFLKDMIGEGRKLQWHKPIHSSHDSSNTGIGVKVTIQMSYSDNCDENLEPSLVWEILHEKRSTESKVRFQDIKSIRQRLSLFDISSVQKASDSMSLHSFPHAAPENSILLTLHDRSIYLFEAKNETEAKLVIHGLRWISARLVFNLLTGNRNVCSEMLVMPENNKINQVISPAVMDAITDHLVDKSIMRLSERRISSRKRN